MDIIDKFKQEIEASGITVPNEIIADGKLHRFSTNGKSSDRSGWYILHTDDPSAGHFGCWRVGISQTWCGKSQDAMTQEERKALTERMDAAKRSTDAARKADRATAAAKAAQRWRDAAPSEPDHPYLKKKGIKPHLIRQSADRALLIPMLRDDKIVGLQRIAADGTKRFLPGSDKRGSSYLVGGDPDEAKKILIAEGLATAATLHEATGLPAFVAFDCGNLKQAAEAIRKRFPKAAIVIAGDNDQWTDGNPGRTKAEEAARAVNGIWCVPDFSGLDASRQPTDFNDLAALAGMGAAKAQIEGMRAGCDRPRPDFDLPFEWLQPPENGTLIIDGPPSVDSGSHWAIHLDWWETGSGGRRRPGVYWHKATESASDDGAVRKSFTHHYLCSPLLIDATTRDKDSYNAGRLLRYQDSDGKWRQWNMPMDMLGGDCSDVRRELLRGGVIINAKDRMRIADYLQSVTPKKKAFAALEVGWFRDAFVLPDETFGRDDIFFQAESAVVADFSRSGTLDDWKRNVASYAAGNMPLMFAISAALAGPLLYLMRMEGAGFHFIGGSSCGKTTAVQAAASVWGGPNFKRTWKSTTNGLEAAAAESNDTLLVLDEIGEATPRDVGRVVYALGNGTGKSRAKQTGHAKNVRRWRTVLLSSGERGLSSIMTEAGERVTAGQEVRLLSIPSDGFEHGTFDSLHSFDSGRHLADHLKGAAGESYGVAGREWLRWLTEDVPNRDLANGLASIVGAFESEGQQEGRAARCFALVALAGELSIEAGITPWRKGEPLAAAQQMFARWISHRGRGNAEERQVIEALQAFVSRFRDRFEDLDHPPRDRNGIEMDRIIPDRAGWIKGGCYHFIPAVFNETIGGIDPKLAKRILKRKGLLHTTNGSARLNAQLPVALNGKRPQVVSVKDSILATNESTVATVATAKKTSPDADNGEWEVF